MFDVLHGMSYFQIPRMSAIVSASVLPVSSVHYCTAQLHAGLVAQGAATCQEAEELPKVSYSGNA